MSKTNLYSLYDTEAETIIGPIMADRRHAPAVRAFNELLANKDTLPGRYPQQFELRWIGEQDTDTAEITSRKPLTIATGREWKEANETALLEQRANAEPGHVRPMGVVD